MGWFFSKGKNDDSDIDLVLPTDDIDLSVIGNIGSSKQDNNQNKPKAPHALTPDEVLGKNNDKAEQVWETSRIPMAGGKTVEVNSATVLLYKRMMESKAAAEKNAEQSPKHQLGSHSTKAESAAQVKVPDLSETNQSGINTNPDAENSKDLKDKTDPADNPTLPTEEKQQLAEPNPNTPTVKETPSLLSRCMPYIIDDNGHDHSEDFPPKYTLESVEDIISSFENKAAQTVTELYGQRVHSSNTDAVKDKSFKVKPQPKKAKAPIKPAAPADTVKKTYDIPMSRLTEQSDHDAENSIKTYQSSFSTIEIPATTINNNGEATITFNLNDIRRATGNSLGQTQQMLISDIGEEKKDSVKEFIAPKSSDFDEIIDDLNGYTCFDDAKRVRHELYRTKRNSLIKLLLTALITLGITVIRFDFLSSFFYGYADTIFAVSTAALALMCIINFKTISAVSSLFKGCKNSDLPIALAAVGVLIHSVLTLIFFDTSTTLNLTPVAGMALSFAALARFLRSAEVVDNFRHIATPHQKNAVDIIKEAHVSEKIIKSGIDGKPYIIAPRKTVNLLGFLKASNSDDAILKKVPMFTLVSLICTVITGIACYFVLDDMHLAVSAAAAVLCLACPPSTLLIGTLTTKLSSSRLKRHDAMICSYESAMSIEPANCVVINANDLFPSGSIELKNMKILGNNSLDKTFLDAASVTLSAKSPLYNVFKDITKSLEDLELPYCDSVKYEDKMGVSGWVDDRHIFIGNRTLLEAHSIAVPSVEIDKKILKKGFFPVYVACNGTAYALLMVRYAPKSDIKQQLRRLAATGVTFYLNSSDPNINAHMVTDYFELYDDSVFILKPDEIKHCQDATNYKESCFAPACYKGSVCGLFAVISEAIKLKTSVNVMTALHIVGAILGIFALCFALFNGMHDIITASAIIIWQLVSLLISCFALFIK